MDRTWTPKSSQAWRARLMARTPARCPKLAGRPRRRAQRPLPSMMIPTWRGTWESKGEERVPIRARCAFHAPLPDPPPVGGGGSAALDLHHLGFFSAGQGVDLLDLALGDLLQTSVRPLRFVFSDVPVLLHLVDPV